MEGGTLNPSPKSIILESWLGAGKLGEPEGLVMYFLKYMSKLHHSTNPHEFLYYEGGYWNQKQE